MRKATLIALTALALAFPALAREASAQSAALIVTERAFAYEKAAKEIEQGFAGAIQSYDMKNGHSKDDEIVRQIQEASPSVVITLGDKARELAAERLPNVPTIAGMVLETGPEAGAAVSKTVQTVTLQIPPQSVLTQLKLILPDMKRIGVVSGEKRFGSLREAAKTFGKSSGLEVVEILVPEKGKLMPLVKEKLADLDAVWVLPDSSVLDASSFQSLVGTLKSSKKALVAYSENFVQAGALFSVSPDYQATGQQIVMMAKNLAGGKAKGAPAVQYPIGTYSVLNLKTAKAIGLTLTPEQTGFINRILEKD